MSFMRFASVGVAVLLLVAGAVSAQTAVSKPLVPTGGTCDPEFDVDVSAGMAQPDGNVQFFDGDCTGAPGFCGDYFDITCPDGGPLTLSTCEFDNGGVVASFDTSLSIFIANAEQACNDDDCAGGTNFFASRLNFAMGAATTYRVRIGSFSDGDAGTYRLAYSAPAGCLIGIVPVELMTFDVE